LNKGVRCNFGGGARNALANVVIEIKMKIITQKTNRKRTLNFCNVTLDTVNISFLGEVVVKFWWRCRATFLPTVPKKYS
jgi:hypothetical protein